MKGCLLEQTERWTILCKYKARIIMQAKKINENSNYCDQRRSNNENWKKLSFFISFIFKFDKRIKTIKNN